MWIFQVLLTAQLAVTGPFHCYEQVRALCASACCHRPQSTRKVDLTCNKAVRYINSLFLLNRCHPAET